MADGRMARFKGGNLVPVEKPLRLTDWVACLFGVFPCCRHPLCVQNIRRNNTVFCNSSDRACPSELLRSLRIWKLSVPACASASASSSTSCVPIPTPAPTPPLPERRQPLAHRRRRRRLHPQSACSTTSRSIRTAAATSPLSSDRAAAAPAHPSSCCCSFSIWKPYPDPDPGQGPVT